MSDRAMKALSEPLKSGIVCIDSYEGKNPTGRIWYSHFEAIRPFGSTMQMLDIIEDAAEEMDYPGAYNEPRTFRDVPEMVEHELPAAQRESEIMPGKLATFKLKIIFRQNASWQGAMSWAEGRKETSFRSTLEMLKLMESAL